MAADFETSTTMRTVGRVVAMFCGCGGLIVTGTTPAGKVREHCTLKPRLFETARSQAEVMQPNGSL